VKGLARLGGFLVVGCLGAVADASVLGLGLAAGLVPAVARAISIALAMQVTFACNGRFIFAGFQPGRLLRQWLGYMLACSLGAAINYGFYLGLIATRLPLVSTHAAAFAIATIIGAGANYLGIKRLAFREQPA
jgi:putative flippase GtrA